MFRTFCFLIIALFSAMTVSSALAGAKRPADSWNYYHFDGTAFKAGPATDTKPFIAVKEKSRPMVLLAQTPNINSIDLPEGAGAISGICYVQNSGGKLGGNGGYTPCAKVPLEISSGGKQLVTVQTDENGYFVVVLAAGTYTIGSGPLAAEIPVERGITSLVPLRAGKRMVD